MASKKILFFFPENPFAKRGGNVTRAYNTLLILKDLGYQIDLVSCTELIEGMGDDFEVDSSIIHNFYPIRRRPVKNLTSFEFWKFKMIKFFSHKNPYNIFITQFLLKNFKSLLQSNTYDFIIINYEFWGPLLHNTNLKGAKTIVDTHDFITVNEFQRNPKMNIGNKLNSELKNLNFFDKIIVISHEETSFFKKFLPSEKVHYIPQSFEDHTLDNTSKENIVTFDLIFVGSDNPFNIKSIQWFFQNVFPLLQNNISIAIVGRICKYVEETKNVTLLNEVEDLSAIYRKSKIAICPMIGGTGMKVKVVEALSFGIPVVGTTNAIDGFPEKSNNGCLVTDSPEEFAASIQLLLKNSKEYDEVKNEGIKYFNKNFSLHSAKEKWRKVFETL